MLMKPFYKYLIACISIVGLLQLSWLAQYVETPVTILGVYFKSANHIQTFAGFFGLQLAISILCIIIFTLIRWSKIAMKLLFFSCTVLSFVGIFLFLLNSGKMPTDMWLLSITLMLAALSFSYYIHIKWAKKKLESARIDGVYEFVTLPKNLLTFAASVIFGKGVRKLLVINGESKQLYGFYKGDGGYYFGAKDAPCGIKGYIRRVGGIDVPLFITNSESNFGTKWSYRANCINLLDNLLKTSEKT